jgi:ribosomal protein S18 acetylase RimI-like enzyme
MPEPPRPFRTERYQIGPSRDGQPVMLDPMTEAGADALGPQLAAFGPWAHYAFGADRMTAGLKRRDGAAVYQIACGPDLAGAAVILSPWLAGPYLQLLAVLPEHQGRGIGARVVAWLEAEARGHFRNLWLCVSGFNAGAQRFYRDHGFEVVATLDGLVRDGDDELLMRKRLSG